MTKYKQLSCTSPGCSREQQTWQSLPLHWQRQCYGLALSHGNARWHGLALAWPWYGLSHLVTVRQLVNCPCCTLPGPGPGTAVQIEMASQWAIYIDYLTSNIFKSANEQLKPKVNGNIVAVCNTWVLTLKKVTVSVTDTDTVQSRLMSKWQPYY